jgi:hypothetical protein
MVSTMAIRGYDHQREAADTRGSSDRRGRRARVCPMEPAIARMKGRKK